MGRIKTLREIQRDHIRQVLAATRGDTGRASRILGVTPGQLGRLIKQHGLGPGANSTDDAGRPEGQSGPPRKP